MSNDLIRRLRQWAEFGYGVEASATMREAADALARKGAEADAGSFGDFVEGCDHLPLARKGAEAAARIEALEAALREIATHPRGGCIDTPEKMDRDDFIGIARAALKESSDE